MFPASLKTVRLSLAALLSGLAVFLIVKAEWRAAVGQWWNADKGKLETVVHGGWWWGSLALSLITAGLILTSKWWAKSWPAAEPAASFPTRPRWLVPVVLVIMAGGLALRAPRLGLSFYNDECHAFRAHLAGEIPKAHLGNPDKFRPASWLSTLYENRSGNNSMLFSILARSSYDTWRKIAGVPPGQVNETAVRLPVLGCGVLSIGAMAWLGFRLGGPLPALLAALLAALHPWHLRYSVEARGYGILMLVMPLMFVALDAALRSGRWRHWLLFGLLQYLAMICWFGSAHFLLGLNLTLATIAVFPALRRRSAAAGQWSLLVPALVSGLLAAGLYLQLNLPHYLQLSKALADPGFFKSPHPFPPEWFQDVAGFLAFGYPGLPPGGPPSGEPVVADLLSTPWVIAIALGCLLWITALTTGFLQAFRGKTAGRAFAGAVMGGALLTLGYCSLKGIVFLKWYAVFLLPGLLMLLALGLGRWGKRWHPWLAYVCALPLAAAWLPGVLYFQNHGKENLRGAVELARGAAYPVSLTNPNRTLYAITWSESAIYDSTAVTLKSAADLQNLIQQSRRENRPLYVAHGHAEQAARHAADVITLLRDPAQFRLTATLPGLDEAGYSHYVYQLLPQTAPPSAEPE